MEKCNLQRNVLFEGINFYKLTFSYRLDVRFKEYRWKRIDLCNGIYFVNSWIREKCESIF